MIRSEMGSMIEPRNYESHPIRVEILTVRQSRVRARFDIHTESLDELCI